MQDNDKFHDYVSGRMAGWRRTAHALCGDWHAADDLVSIVLLKVHRHWDHIGTVDHPDAYVRRMLTRTLLDERRRSWRRETPSASLLEQEALAAGPESVIDRRMLTELIAELPAGRRDVVVLRYLCDLSVEDTAEQLGCSLTAVKTRSFRALKALRMRLHQAEAMTGEASAAGSRRSLRSR